MKPASPLKNHAGIAARMAKIQPFHVMEMMERARQLEAGGHSIIHMEIGQPDFGAPPQVIAQAVRAMQSDPLGYTTTLGLPALREAIAGHYARQYGVTVSPQRIAVTAGASGAFVIALGVLVDPGDEVVMPDPCYSCNPNFVRMFDGIPVFMPVDEASSYQPVLADVQRCWTPRTRGVLLASPSNPTGTLMARQEVRAIADWVHAQGGFVIMDEIYQGLVYDQAWTTAASESADIWVINSFSKYFGMTGWRLGWMLVPECRMPEVEKLAQNAFICPPAPAQQAALAAFRNDTLEVLERRRIELQRRRDFLVPALEGLGFRIASRPAGAFYVYAGCQAFGEDSSVLAMAILEQLGVAITPGVDFGSHRASQHVRFAYTRSMLELEEGMARLSRLRLR
jgi:aspartate/methionine/tyrosine aminotransferase